MATIAILGYGTVGSGVLEVLRRNAASIERRAGQPVTVKYICDIRDFSSHPDAALFVNNIDVILSDPEVTAVVETIGGLKPAYFYVKSALESGRHVVTSNKELVATHGAELLAIARRRGVCFLFEASVGGGTPIITPMHQCMAANVISEIAGIVNGTTNFMLTKMARENMDFGAALKLAQSLGYAETIDPSADVDGIDAQRKISILASLAFGRHFFPQNVPTRGIRDVSVKDIALAARQGAAVRLIAWARRGDDGSVALAVEPMLIPREKAQTLNVSAEEIRRFREISEKMYLPYDKELDIFVQHDTFLDKDLMPASELPAEDRPLNQKWSWDRILRSCFIKQADVLQGLYFLEHLYDKETIRRNFDFYEPMTVHESSLSPCVHSILAASLGKLDRAQEFYRRTARLDLDNINNDTCDGLHITSMAGSWLSIVQGFAGMRTLTGQLSFDPQLPDGWDGYAFKIVYRGRLIEVSVSRDGTGLKLLSGDTMTVLLHGREVTLVGSSLNPEDEND